MQLLFRFVEYKPTSLEKVHKTELHTDHDLGVIIDLINPDTYKVCAFAICLCNTFFRYAHCFPVVVKGN